MTSEQPLPRPLTTEEIKDGICFKIAQQVREGLDKSCTLFGTAYPRFKGTVKIHLELDNFTTQPIIDNREVKISSGDGEIGSNPSVIDTELELPHTPPNKFRVDTEQAIPMLVTQNGISTEKKVRYSGRKKAK